MQSDIDLSMRIIQKAKEKEQEQRHFLQWVVQLPHMIPDENYISFNDYVDRVTGRNIDNRPVTECMKELEEVKKMFK